MSERTLAQAHEEQARIRLPKVSGLIVFFAIVAGMAVLPMVLDAYTLLVLIPFFGYGIALLGFNLLFGYTGLLSFGHAMFIGIGAYTAAALTSEMGIRHFELILLASIVFSALIAIPVGALCVRYTRIFFGMLTLAFGMLFHSFLFKFYTITGGDQGMRIERPLLFGMDPDMGQTAFLTGPFYYYALGLLALFGLVMWRIVQSPLGVHLKAVRENADKAAYLGVRVYRIRLIAFVISAVYGAVGGTILATTVGLANPELVFWTHSGDLVFMTVLGGSGVFAGPVIGTLGFVLLQDVITTATEYWRFVMGTILIFLVIFAPGGLAGTVLKLIDRRNGGN